MIDTASAGTSIFEQDGLSAMFVAPNSSSYRNLNDWSAVVRIEFLHTSFLFCGDAETESEQEMLALAGALLNADVLKVAHHGSNTSSSRAFLEAVSPSYAVIQVGAENSYGHPSERTLERLADIGAEVFRTDLCGTVVIVSDGTTVEVLRVEHP
jgi:beta-lactamase superfamily II metal-dependent hydrolase